MPGSALVMVYRGNTQGHRPFLSAAQLLRERGAQQVVTQVYSRSQAQVGLVKSFGAARRRIVTILPSIDIK